MKESQLNTILSRSLNKLDNGWFHKIADPLHGTGIQNPFDGFGVLNEKPIYIESKLIKNGIYAVNFNRIEEHQIANLNEINQMLQDKSSLCLIAVGFYQPRKLNEIVFFSIDYILYLKKKGIKSIKKKELLKLREKGHFLKINYVKGIDGKRRQYIDLEKLARLEEYLINYDE